MRRPDRWSRSGRGGMSGRVCLQVLDEGPGIPAADLEHVFDKFYRVRGCRSPACGHRAWALPSVAASSRPCMAPSQPPTGPIARARLSPSRCRCTPMRNGRRRRSNDRGSGPLRILVVDDEPAILRFLRVGLGGQGYRGQRSGERTIGTGCGATAPRRSGGARSGAAGHRWAGGHPAHPRIGFRGADHRAVQPRRRGGEGGGAGSWG